MYKFCSKDGVSIACRHSGSGKAILLVHGTTGDHLTWAPIITALESRFSVWAMDRRGRGASGDALAYALRNECEDIAAVADAIGEPVAVIGHSFGGLCALNAALLTPNIDKLVLYEASLSLAGSGWSADIGRQMHSLLQNGENEAAMLLFLRDVIKTPAAEIALMQAGQNWAARVAVAHTIHRELKAVEQYCFEPSLFQSLVHPCLLLLGSESHSRRYTTAQTLMKALPNSSLAMLQGQQHGAMRTAPDLFVNKIVKFLG